MSGGGSSLREALGRWAGYVMYGNDGEKKREEEERSDKEDTVGLGRVL